MQTREAQEEVLQYSICLRPYTFFYKPSSHSLLLHMLIHNSLLSYRSDSTLSWCCLNMSLSFVCSSCCTAFTSTSPSLHSLHRFTSFIIFIDPRSWNVGLGAEQWSHSSSHLIASTSCYEAQSRHGIRHSLASGGWRRSRSETVCWARRSLWRLLRRNQSGHNMEQPSQCGAARQLWSLDRLAIFVFLNSF